MDSGQIFKNLGEDDGAAGDLFNNPELQQILNMLTDQAGNRGGMRLAGNSYGDKMKKVTKDLSAFKLTFDGDKSGKGMDKSRALLREKARSLTASAKYYEATTLLEDIYTADERVDLGTELLLAVCYLQLGRENKANKSIEKIRKSLLQNPTIEADELLEMIDRLVDSNAHTSALILLPVASELCQRLTVPNDVLDGLFRCILKANGCTGPMLTQGGRARVLAIDFGLDFMVETLKDLKNLHGADAQKRAMQQGLATILIAYDYWVLKENLKGVRLREEAILSLEEAFGIQRAKQKRIYGITFYNIGVGYDILGKHSKAREAYDKAIDAIESATDYDDDEVQRQTDLKMCKQKLKELHI